MLCKFQWDVLETVSQRERETIYIYSWLKVVIFPVDTRRMCEVAQKSVSKRDMSFY